jgi:hypothetical protein
VGAHNVSAALRASGKVTSHAKLTLTVVALVSLDRDYDRSRARLYYAGHIAICEALDEFPTAAAVRRIRHDLAELIAAGLLEPYGWVNRHRCYRLTLREPVDNPVEKPP